MDTYNNNRLTAEQQYNATATHDPALNATPPAAQPLPMPILPPHHNPNLNPLSYDYDPTKVPSMAALYYGHNPAATMAAMAMDPIGFQRNDAMEQMFQHSMQQFDGGLGSLGACTSTSANAGISDANKQKRKKEVTPEGASGEDSPDLKKSSTSDEKKVANLRKNIRDVMDENQLDADTLVAQREESERLARVAEQQKIIREYQRQTAAHKRTQNRVLSLLKSCDTYTKTVVCSAEDASTDETVAAAVVNQLQEAGCESNSLEHVFAATTSSGGALIDEATPDLVDLNNGPCSPATSTNMSAATLAASSGGKELEEGEIPHEVVTIEDSSSEDDCIMLSDDEDDEEEDDEDDDLEEEHEDDPNNSGLHVKDSYNVPDELGRVVVNVGHPEGEEDIYVAPQIAKTIKPHQIGGVRFLFDNIIESTKRFQNSSGFGCILAHSMGLGKTLQVICFCDIILRHTSSKTVLCVMPINTLQNWVSEFDMWIPKNSHDPSQLRPRHFDVFVLNDQHKTLTARARVVLQWAQQGGVLLIGYELFRLMALKLLSTRKRRSKNAYMQSASDTNNPLMESIYEALVKPGPDLVICDEGHRIKNSNAGISVALKQIRTKRRIVLTGYPLQNNLIEYWCMVDFVRPNYLGTRTEFCNMFERPIQNGQCIDSTPEDIKLMRYRAHVLHSLLLGFVQRRSHMVLQQTLPQKLEYVILTRMTPFQRQLYQTFMNGVVRLKAVPNPLKAFAICCKIWNHPDVLYTFLKKHETDLDLEIDDSDMVSDALVAPAAATAEVPPQVAVDTAAPKTSPEEPIKSEEGKEEIDKIKPESGECEASGGSASVNEDIKPLATVADSKPLSLTTGEMTPITNPPSSSGPPTTSTAAASGQGGSKTAGVYDNNNAMLTTENYYQQCGNLLPYSGDCDGAAGFWQEPNVPYFVYKTLSGNGSGAAVPPAPPKPDPYGQPKAVGEEAAHSSEIVDLDTNEIKTCETIIDASASLKNQAATITDEEEELEPGEIPRHMLHNDGKPFSIKNDSSQYHKPMPSGMSAYRWAAELLKKYEPGVIENSPKMEVFFCILNESIMLGDRVLLFSQSLLTLNLIEYFLQTNCLPGTNMHWHRNHTYFRLDGSTTSQEREKLVNEFNGNTNVKLFLISTRAGSLGINLVGANRVVVFDASWNPCHDTQAVYRIYRYGQRKLCYVYRIVMDKCLEKKIYDRQIKKQGMSDRVVDECNPDAHLSMKDVTNLCHDFDYDDVTEEKNAEKAPDFTQPLDSYTDAVMQMMIGEHKGCLSKEPFLHESLLIDRKEKKLSQAEKRQAHRGYEMEKKATIKQTQVTTFNKFQYRTIAKDGTIIKRPIASIRPMQTTKTPTGGGGIRSTRWIPAEVWQRQGMTAQEMTLPLDVVIPTNTSDKSNIVLKAGQRVMVLKSAKGIYMQLDSGKIIAIRTSSKVPNDDQKANKDEVIDITSEDDAPPKAITTSDQAATADSKDQKSSHIEKCIDNVSARQPHFSSDYHSNGAMKAEYEHNGCGMSEPLKSNNSSAQSMKDYNLSAAHAAIGDSNALNKNKLLAHNSTSAPLAATAYASSSSSSNSNSQKPSASVVPPNSQYGLPMNAAHLNYTYHDAYSKTHHGGSLSGTTPLATGYPPTTTTPASNTHTSSNSKSEGSKSRSTYQLNQSAVYSNNGTINSYECQPNAAANGKIASSSTADVTRVESSKNKGGYSSSSLKSAYSAYPATHKGDKTTASAMWKTAADNAATSIASASHLPLQSTQAAYAAAAAAQHTPPQQLSDRAKLAQVLQQQQQSQQHAALPLYMPPPPPPPTHYRMDQPSSSGVSGTVGAQQRSESSTSAASENKQQQLLPNAFYADREAHHALGYQHYNNNLYNNANFSATCDYTAQLPDYSAAAAYGSYGHHHPQYHHSNLHSNSYRNIVSAAPAISSNPYGLHHWSPLVAGAANEQFYPPAAAAAAAAAAASYPQNGVQNPWCNP